MNLLTQKRRHKLGWWLLGSTGATLMIAWNWKLVLATATGISFMVLVYQMQGWNWQRRWFYWGEFLKSFQGKLTVAAGSGGLAVIGSYMAISIWSEAQNRWLATGFILQGLGTLLTLGLLGWHIFHLQEEKQENQYHQWVSELTDVNPLQRLIAVQNLSHLVNKKVLSPNQTKELGQYFSLMLTKEPEMVIRQVLLESYPRLHKIQ